MNNQILLILILAGLQGWCQKVKVTQSDRLLIVRAGQPVNMSCHQNSEDNYVALWYQQKPRQALQIMVYSADAKVEDMEAGYTSWRLQRPSLLQSSLSKTVAEAEDSAVYFCAASPTGLTNSAAYFGAGTALSVLEEGKNQKKPDVSIYRPKKRELEDNNFISLVCVASNFFPEHVKIRWFVNSEERINLYEPVPQKNADDSYSTSKRLTLTREEYFNPDTTFRCVAAFLDGTLEASEEIKGETDCGVSKEFYTMYINQGKISYIMVLCKSGLYALVVLVLVWRKKVIAHSY